MSSRPPSGAPGLSRGGAAGHRLIRALSGVIEDSRPGPNALIGQIVDSRPASLSVRLAGFDNPVPCTASDLRDLFPLDTDDIVVCMHVGAGWHVVDRLSGSDPEIDIDNIRGPIFQSGTGDPDPEDGHEGDFYLRLSDLTLFGPFEAGSWGVGVSLAPSGTGEVTGEVKWLAVAVVPPGYVAADGQALTAASALRTALIAAGNPHGVSGSDPKVPDLRGQGMIGAGTGAGLTARTLGQVLGVENVTLNESQIPAHTHNGPSHTHNGPDHTHTGPSHTHGSGGAAFALHNGVATILQGSGTAAAGISATVAATAAAGTGATGSGGTGATSAAGTGATSSTGGGTSHTNMPPSVVLYPVIKL